MEKNSNNNSSNSLTVDKNQFLQFLQMSNCIFLFNNLAILFSIDYSDFFFRKEIVFVLKFSFDGKNVFA